MAKNGNYVDYVLVFRFYTINIICELICELIIYR